MERGPGRARLEVRDEADRGHGVFARCGVWHACAARVGLSTKRNSRGGGDGAESARGTTACHSRTRTRFGRGGLGGGGGGVRRVPAQNRSCLAPSAASPYLRSGLSWTRSRHRHRWGKRWIALTALCPPIGKEWRRSGGGCGCMSADNSGLVIDSCGWARWALRWRWWWRWWPWPGGRILAYSNTNLDR